MKPWVIQLQLPAEPRSLDLLQQAMPRPCHIQRSWCASNDPRCVFFTLSVRPSAHFQLISFLLVSRLKCTFLNVSRYFEVPKNSFWDQLRDPGAIFRSILICLWRQRRFLNLCLKNEDSAVQWVLPVLAIELDQWGNWLRRILKNKQPPFLWSNFLLMHGKKQKILEAW